MSGGMWSTLASAAGLTRPKKKFHFNVSFSLQELRNCTYVSGLMFAKVRLKNGGSFSAHSDRYCDVKQRQGVNSRLYIDG